MFALVWFLSCYFKVDPAYGQVEISSSVVCNSAPVDLPIEHSEKRYLCLDHTQKRKDVIKYLQTLFDDRILVYLVHVYYRPNAWVPFDLSLGKEEVPQSGRVLDECGSSCPPQWTWKGDTLQKPAHRIPENENKTACLWCRDSWKADFTELGRVVQSLSAVLSARRQCCAIFRHDWKFCAVSAELKHHCASAW